MRLDMSDSSPLLMELHPPPHPSQRLSPGATPGSNPSPSPSHSPACPSPRSSEVETDSLLSFMDTACNSIKLALDRPSRSRRKVNHRKYLQKQIKRCTQKLSPGDGENDDKDDNASDKEAATANKPVSRRDSHIGVQSKSLAALFDPNTLKRPVNPAPTRGRTRVPLRKRNLPPSFFTEPGNQSGHRGSLQTCAVAGSWPLDGYRHPAAGVSDSLDIFNPDIADLITNWQDESGHISDPSMPAMPGNSTMGMAGSGDHAPIMLHMPSQPYGTNFNMNFPAQSQSNQGLLTTAPQSWMPSTPSYPSTPSSNYTASREDYSRVGYQASSSAGLSSSLYAPQVHQMPNGLPDFPQAFGHGQAAIGQQWPNSLCYTYL
ncbi:PREDICTED: protein FAM181B-like [Branchiostoma belcheri]|uniref:Protein FAM181B-like n=1 Tax=Branchiostoma belcheri TaxID=7741 RepID=A0A6P4YX67_BRABE|nr:PREDICTED: protein FAM181B-like [Branchiostoma belcheri]